MVFLVGRFGGGGLRTRSFNILYHFATLKIRLLESRSNNTKSSIGPVGRQELWILFKLYIICESLITNLLPVSSSGLSLFLLSVHDLRTDGTRSVS